MAEKMYEPILHIKGWVNGRILIAVVRLYYRVLCVDHVPSPLRTQESDWELGLGLGLAQ